MTFHTLTPPGLYIHRFMTIIVTARVRQSDAVQQCLEMKVVDLMLVLCVCFLLMRPHNLK